MIYKIKIPIKAITFDYWSTLYYESKDNYKKAVEKRIEIIHENINKVNESFSIDQIRKAVKYETKQFYKNWELNHCTLLPEQRLKLSLDYLNIQLSDNDFLILSKKLEKISFLYPPTLADGIYDVLKSISDMNIKIGIISDTGYSKGTMLKKSWKRIIY